MIFILLTYLCLILFSLLQSAFLEWCLSWGYRTELCIPVLSVSFVNVSFSNHFFFFSAPASNPYLPIYFG